MNRTYIFVFEIGDSWDTRRCCSAKADCIPYGVTLKGNPLFHDLRNGKAVAAKISADLRRSAALPCSHLDGGASVKNAIARRSIYCALATRLCATAKAVESGRAYSFSAGITVDLPTRCDDFVSVTATPSGYQMTMFDAKGCPDHTLQINEGDECFRAAAKVVEFQDEAAAMKADAQTELQHWNSRRQALGANYDWATVLDPLNREIDRCLTILSEYRPITSAHVFGSTRYKVRQFAKALDDGELISVPEGVQIKGQDLVLSFKQLGLGSTVRESSGEVNNFSPNSDVTPLINKVAAFQKACQVIRDRHDARVNELNDLIEDGDNVPAELDAQIDAVKAIRDRTMTVADLTGVAA